MWNCLKRYFGNTVPKPEHMVDMGNGNYLSPADVKELFAESERIAKRALIRCSYC